MIGRPKQVSDERLKAIAYETFVELGPQISVSVIAKRLGVTSAALFQRVGTKQELLRMAVRPELPPEYRRLQEGFKKGDPPAKQLVEILNGLGRYISAEVPAIFLMHAGGIPTPGKERRLPRREPPLLELRILLSSWIVGAYKPAGMKKQRADLLGKMLIGALEGHCMHAYLLGHDFAELEFRDLIKSMVAEVSRR
jgi:AcrR family transcriptional regulator